MSAPFNSRLARLLDSDVFVTLATIQADGSPQVSPVWAGRDGYDILISTTASRQKARNIRRDPRVSVTIVHPDRPYRYAEIRGHAHLETEGAQALLDALSHKYTGVPYAQFNPSAAQGEQDLVVLRVTPTQVVNNL